MALKFKRRDENKGTYIHKSYKFRLYPNQEQLKLLLQHAGNARFYWNYLIEQAGKWYDHTKFVEGKGKFKFAPTLSKELTVLKHKPGFEFLKISYTQSLQEVIKYFDNALRESFKKKDGNGAKKGFPKFKKRNSMSDSFSFKQIRRPLLTFKEKYVNIPKIGDVKWVKTRELEGRPKRMTISQDGFYWYCSVTCEVPFESKPLIVDKEHLIGIDFGLKTLATLNQEEGSLMDIVNPKFLIKNEERLIMHHRRLSKKQRASWNRHKQILRLRKVYSKVKNSRKDYIHKMTSSLIAKGSGVVVEGLFIPDMVKKRRFSKGILDAAWGEMRRQLEYKCKWNHKPFIVLDRYEPTTKTCSDCGNLQKMPIHVRVYKCQECGFELCRDKNAAINILNKGIEILNTAGSAGIQACGAAFSKK